MRTVSEHYFLNFRWKPQEEFHCPTKKTPFFYTRLNSNQTLSSSSSQNKSESSRFGDWMKEMNPLSIMAAVAMVLVFTVFTVRLLTRGQKKLHFSIAERDSRDNQPFFNSEVKQLHY